MIQTVERCTTPAVAAVLDLLPQKKHVNILLYLLLKFPGICHKRIRIHMADITNNAMRMFSVKIYRPKK